ncbi:STAS domain-containing protein [Brachyspira intermedia]|uniref:STAS domain-containing protein n=1 Tax=Brachyspira intermedia TaxID=84377 RepID=UPI001F183C37|nr:STAS domain-containing protein [Brachyspira intermedia]
MEDVYYIDSSGIGVFISALGAFKKVNGKICFVKVTDPVKKVFELTKINSFFLCLQQKLKLWLIFNLLKC